MALSSGPNIPVRYTKRLNSRRLNQMNGDFLLHLKTNSVRSEFGQHVSGLNHAADHETKKKVDMWFKEQKHALAKLTKGQGSVYKTLLRVHQEKKKIMKRQEERKRSINSSTTGKSNTPRDKDAGATKDVAVGTRTDTRKIGGESNTNQETKDNNLLDETQGRLATKDVVVLKDGISNHRDIQSGDVSQKATSDGRSPDKNASVNHNDANDPSVPLKSLNRNETSRKSSYGSESVNNDTSHAIVVADGENVNSDSLNVQTPRSTNHKRKTKEQKKDFVPHFTAPRKINRAKALEVRKANPKSPSTVIKKESSVSQEDFVSDNSVLERYLSEQALLMGDRQTDDQNHRDDCYSPLQARPHINKYDEPTTDGNNNTVRNSNVNLKTDPNGENNGIVIETGKNIPLSPRIRRHSKAASEEDDQLSCTGRQIEIQGAASPVREQIIEKLHDDYRKMRSRDARGSLPPLKVNMYSPHRIPPDSYLKANAIRHTVSASDAIEAVSNANKYFDFPRPTVKETLETWYDTKLANKSKKQFKNRRPTMVELNNIYASLKEAKQRAILNEPFQVYRQSASGGIVADELPHRRASFPIPSAKAKTMRRHLLEEERHNRRSHRRQLDTFFQTLSNEEDDKHAQVTLVEPIEEEEVKTNIAPGPSISLPQYLLKVYKQIELPEGMDPDSAEALNYCKYLRPYSPKSQQARQDYSATDRRMSSWDPKGFIAPPTELLQSIME